MLHCSQLTRNLLRHSTAVPRRIPRVDPERAMEKAFEGKTIQPHLTFCWAMIFPIPQAKTRVRDRDGKKIGNFRKAKNFFGCINNFFSRWLIDKRSRVVFKPFRNNSNRFFAFSVCVVSQKCSFLTPAPPPLLPGVNFFPVLFEAFRC